MQDHIITIPQLLILAAICLALWLQMRREESATDSGYARRRKGERHA